VSFLAFESDLQQWPTNSSLIRVNEEEKCSFLASFVPHLLKFSSRDLDCFPASIKGIMELGYIAFTRGPARKQRLLPVSSVVVVTTPPPPPTSLPTAPSSSSSSSSSSAAVASALVGEVGDETEESRKTAKREYNRRYRAKNKDANNQKMKLYYEEHKASISQQRKQFRDGRKDIISEKSKQYYALHKVKLKEYQKRHRGRTREALKLVLDQLPTDPNGDPDGYPDGGELGPEATYEYA
jgi:hypothetical protein